MTISQGGDAVGPAALAVQVGLFRSAVLAGASQTAACSGALMNSTMRWPAASTARTTACGLPGTGGARLITTAANAASA